MDSGQWTVDTNQYGVGVADNTYVPNSGTFTFVVVRTFVKIISLRFEKLPNHRRQIHGILSVTTACTFFQPCFFLRHKYIDIPTSAAIILA